MRDPKWIGTSPDRIFWDADSRYVFFNWNPDAADTPSLYRVHVQGRGQPIPEAVDWATEDQMVRDYKEDRQKRRMVFVRNGNIYLREKRSGKETQLTSTASQQSSPRFAPDGKRIVYLQDRNFFSLSLQNGKLKQLTNFVRGDAGPAGAISGRDQQANDDAGAAVRNRPREGSDLQSKWLATEQLGLFEVLQERKRLDSIRESRTAQRQTNSPEPGKVIFGEGSLGDQQISPDLRYVSFKLTTSPTQNRPTIVPDYVNASGYVENIPTRTKVGNALPVSRYYLLDRHRDTVYALQTNHIPGIRDLPDFWNDYPEKKKELDDKNEERNITLTPPYWNEDGSSAFVIALSTDNKDRWILRLHPEDGSLTLIDRQRDEAWIGGPGIGGVRSGAGHAGWVDDRTIYFQSEASGYSHIYTADIFTGEIRQLTSGNWEVQSLQLSPDNRQFYFKANREHPGITHFYRLPVNGGMPVRLTALHGGNEVTLSPDGKWLAIRHSSSNKPWELYLQENKPGAPAVQVTHSLTEEFKAYPWRDPEVISFENRYGDEVYARIYQPETPKAGRPAVIFVHGAGYLQNVHYWWSQYFREYMFHNLLADLGYTVLDIDFTASSGYGRDHRTGIYRHMGGKDLSDQVDGARLLVEKYGINPDNIGIYGGSYGGFITLMAMFREPGVFAAGAALRSVTDWAHYNHGYTSNILNEPFSDPIAYRRSSPIYFAEGLEGALLMCHGMVDVNVHFQDIVRLSQRLIELGKDNWELAVYPLEDHAFTTPSSWTDEYKRILRLFEENLDN